MYNKKKRIWANIMAFVMCIASIFCITGVAEAKNGLDDSFDKVLENNNTLVVGNPIEMTIAEAEGLLPEGMSLNMLECKDGIKTEIVEMTPEEILKLHYLSLSSKEQEVFLKKVKNEKVDICKEGGTILISYNVNRDAITPRATMKISSSREATIKMQDSVSGRWGSATVMLIGNFTKVQYGSKWTVSLASSSDYDIKESDRDPVSIASTTVYWEGAEYSSSGTYVGNEINISSYTQTVCGMNASGLWIYVYPNSDYNYAKIN